MNLLPWGGAAVTLFDWLLPRHGEKRLAAWLAELDRRLDGLENLMCDEDTFVTIVVEASKAALATHLEEKLRLLSACVRSAAEARSENAFMAMRYVHHVDALEPEHFAVLAEVARSSLAFNGSPRHPDWTELEGVADLSSEVWRACLTDLDRLGLADLSNAQDGAQLRTPDETWLAAATAEGRELLRFVDLIAI